MISLLLGEHLDLLAGKLPLLVHLARYCLLLRLFRALRCLLYHLGTHIFEVFLGELAHALRFEILVGWWSLYDRLTLHVALCSVLPMHHSVVWDVIVTRGAEMLTTRGDQLSLHGDGGTGF